MRARPTTLGLAVLLTAGALVAAGAPAKPQQESYSIPATGAPETADARPDIGVSAVISRVGGRVTYRPVGVKRSRTLTSEPVEVRFGARVDATRGRVLVRIGRTNGGATSAATFYDGVFRLSEQDTAAPYVATLTLAGASYENVCGEQAGTARAAQTKRSRKRVRRLWGDGKGRYRTRGRYSAATVRGTKWLTDDRCDGTLTRVARGEVVVEDFTQFDQDTSTPPSSSPAPTGGGEDGGQSPAAAPAPQRSPKRKQVRVRKGGSYTAAPKG